MMPKGRDERDEREVRRQSPGRPVKNLVQGPKRLHLSFVGICRNTLNEQSHANCNTSNKKSPSEKERKRKNTRGPDAQLFHVVSLVFFC